MSKEGNETKNRLTLQIPIIKAESETQTTGLLVSISPPKEPENMDAEDRQSMSIRKRRNLSKNRGQAARQREKTPEPSRTLIPHEDTTSDDEDTVREKPQRNSREVEAETSFLEMKRLVQEKANVKDPVYDIDTDEILEQRAFAANERRRRSISPFAIPDVNKLNDESASLEKKGSFIDPTNKLLSTSYTLSPKDEDSSRRSSLTIEPPAELLKRGISPPTPTSTSPKEKNFPYPLPTTPKKLQEMVYPDEKKSDDKPKTPVRSEDVFTFEEKDKEVKPPIKPKTPDAIPTPTREIVTKVIEIERTPSKKLTAEKKPVVEVRERIVRTPSRKMSADVRPVIAKQAAKQARDEPQSRAPPVKPARSKSATRFGVSFYIKLFVVLFIALLITLFFQLA